MSEKRFTVVAAGHPFEFDTFSDLIHNGPHGFMPPDANGKIGGYAFGQLNDEDRGIVSCTATMADILMNTIDNEAIDPEDGLQYTILEQMRSEIACDIQRKLAAAAFHQLQDMVWAFADYDKSYQPPEEHDR